MLTALTLGRKTLITMGFLGVQCKHEEYLQVSTNALETPQCSELKDLGL